MGRIPHDAIPDFDMPQLSDTCPHCGIQLPPFLLRRHMQVMHPAGAEADVLSTYDAIHPNSASAKFAELVREAAARGAK
jgi:hypothetical protein